MGRQVVISGLGVVSAFGIGADAAWQGVCEGRSAVARITRFDPSGFACRVAGEIRELSARDFVPKSYRKAVKVMARDIELAVAAAKLAVQDAGIVTRGSLDGAEGQTTYASERMGCHIGAGLISAETEELTSALATAVGPDGEFSLKRWGAAEGGGGGMNNLQPLWMLKYLPNMLACHVTIIHGAEGPSNTLTCAEASGLLSIGESCRVIERGAADLCFSGGAECKISLMGVLRLELAGRAGFTGDASDGSPCMPYHPESVGVPGEGGGILILESQEHAAARGARVYARISGFGAAQSPHPAVPPLGRGQLHRSGLELAIRAALRDANAAPEDIDAVVPHGSGTAALDEAEIGALSAVFGARLPQIPLVTLVPMLGDCYAGNGGIAVAIGAASVFQQRLPAHIVGASPAGRGEAIGSRAARLDRVLVCTGGMGGQNAAIVLSRPLGGA